MTTYLTNNCNTQIEHYLKKKDKAKKFRQLIKCKMGNFLSENHTQNEVEKLFPDSFLKKTTKMSIYLYQ